MSLNHPADIPKAQGNATLWRPAGNGSAVWLFLVTMVLSGALDAACASGALAGPPLRVENAPGKPRQITPPDQTPEGLSQSDWQSIRAAHTAWEHSVMPVEGRGGVWQARNKGQQWTTRFDRRGFITTPKDAAWQWGLELRSYGFGIEQTAVGGRPEVETAGGRLTYQWDERMQEWFLNDERGLEHGFVLQQRPAGAEESAPLEVVLAVRGSLRAGLSGDGQTLHFRDELGAPVVNYGGLKVWDADGRVLPSRFAVDADGTVALRIEESTARYPITIDPIAQQAYLKADSPPGYLGSNDHFGYSVASNGDTVVIGAPHEDSSTTGVNSTPDDSAPDSGAAYVFVRNGTTWSQQAYLKASQIASGDPFGEEFGTSVAVNGDTVVVGAPDEDSSTTGVNTTPDESALNAGAAYVFVRSGTTWNQQAYLKAGQVSAFDGFGLSVAVSGDTVVVGAHNSTPDELVPSSGAAYVFVRTGTVWSQQAYLKAIQGNSSDRFGTSVGVSGDTVVIGAPDEDSGTTGVNSTPNDLSLDTGAAYVFVRTGTVWSQQAYLKASQVSFGDFFGTSVAVSGDTVVVGAPDEDSSRTGVNSTPNEGARNAGAAYVYVRSGTTWSEQAYLKAGQVSAFDNFGHSVAVNGDTVVIGAPIEDSSMTGVNSTPDELVPSSGAAYVFVRTGTTWSQQAYLKASQVSASDNFGTSVAVSGDAVVVGAPNEDSSTTEVNSTPNEGVENAGAALIYVRGGTTWSQQGYLKHNEPPGYAGAGDAFGWRSVAVSGDTVVIGAPNEDSSTTGVNSSPNEGALDAGAAYVFVRSGTTWSQQAYLKASQVSTSDNFGTSVAVSGDTVVVGARAEDSSTTGVNSTPNDGAERAGAAYVFVRSGTTWSQQAYLKASQVSAFDNFGTSVAVSGDAVVVGAPLEDSSATGVNSTPNEAATGAGAAYVFVRSGTEWTQQAYLKASQVNSNDRFGTWVAVGGETVVVGALYEDSSITGVNSMPNEGAIDSGAAYVFVRNGMTWNQQAYLKSSQVSTGDQFGTWVAVSGDTVVVGAPFEDSSTTGVNSMPNEGAVDSGAAYVFVRSGTIWSEQAYLKASQVSAGDQFGDSVAVDGDTVVVGAPAEDSNTTGVNSTPDKLAAGSGAAYVFVRSGTIWSEQAYLKASQVSARDAFGSAVAVSGDAVVVGSSNEDSNTTGVNSTPNELGYNSGAAYIFTGFGPAAAEFSLSGNSVEILNGDATPSTADHTDFGSVNVTGGAVARTFTIANSGTFALNLTGAAPDFVTLSGSSAFSVTAQPASAAVAADGGTVTFVITYDPETVGTHTATASIASDDPDENPFTFAISGAGRETLSALEVWRQTYFGTTANSGDGADDADSDHDGLVNLIEWACGLDPTTGGVLPASLVRNGSSLEFTYTRSVSAVNAGAIFAIEWSDTLLAASWSHGDVTEQVLSDDGTVQVVKATLPGGDSEGRFVRLRIVAPT